MPAENLDLPPGSFDAAISRNCLMFVTDLPRTLAAIRTALRPGARFAASVWGPLERNPFHGAPIAAVCRRREIPSPAPEVVRAISLSDGDRVVDALCGAGFQRVELRPVRGPRRFPSFEDALKSGREFPTFVALLGLLPESERERAWAEIAARVVAFRDAHRHRAAGRATRHRRRGVKLSVCQDHGAGGHSAMLLGKPPQSEHDARAPRPY